MAEQTDEISSRLRICLVTNELPGVTPYTGGIGVRFLATARALAELGHEVTLLVHRPSKLRNPRLEVLKDAGVRIEVRSVRKLRLIGIPTPLANALGFGFALGRGRRFDIVFAPEWGGWASFYSIWRSHDGGRLVTSLATSWKQAQAANSAEKHVTLSGFLQNRLERLQTLRSDALIPVSTAILRWTKSIWPLGCVPVQVIPNGLDKASIDALPVETHSVDTERPIRILFTGRLSVWKGVDVLVDAVELLWKRGVEFELCLVGTPEVIRGMPSDTYIRDVSIRHGSTVAVMGHLGREAVLQRLVQSDIAVFPSRFEAFGNGALEAKMAGKAVVVTKGSGFDDFCVDGLDCLMVEPGNAEELADALEALVQDASLRETLGKEAEIRSRSLDIGVVATQLVGVFEDTKRRSKRRASTAETNFNQASTKPSN